MAHYIGPKARINRRLRAQVYESSGAVRASGRREHPPGMHLRARRPSNYGLGLYEKQKIKHYYGLGERQLRRLFDKAGRTKGNTGQQLLLLCERRLDNVVRRAGFTNTRSQARQGVVHGHFQVNGIKVNKPSYLLRPGDVITVRPRKNLQLNYQGHFQERPAESLDWLAVDAETLRATMQGLPGPSDISLPVDANLVVEFLSR
ncbi:MAG: 30S ribosomal protein S4 [Planctomycetota bacterium]|nr:30S ribosomal protein S4 [Planctomycetota bacterium]MDA1179796.1 30S ribosomal protein S4 [Planctomycetota bacterium]